MVQCLTWGQRAGGWEVVLTGWMQWAEAGPQACVALSRLRSCQLSSRHGALPFGGPHPGAGGPVNELQAEGHR